MAMLKTLENSQIQTSFEKLFQLESLEALIEAVQIFAHKAFQNKHGAEWRELQFVLFEMNLSIMQNGFGLGTSRSLRDWIIRNTIEHVEKQYQPQEKVPDELKKLEAFIPWIKERISTHRVNHHPLFILFDNDDLSSEEIRYFLANYRVNMQRFHLHVAAYSLIVPFKMREELYHNLHDEFGQGDFSQAHPNLFEPLMDYFGGVREDDIDYINVETCHLLNTMISLCWFADSLHYGIGGMGGLELAIPLQQRRVLAHLRRRELSDDMVRFFIVHCELDEDHGEGWFNAGSPYIVTDEDFQRVFDGAMRMLEARAGLYDGILKGILARRKHEQAD
jgi:pyrroloquinoline quinone (PQQ) biosynthesis protein C